MLLPTTKSFVAFTASYLRRDGPTFFSNHDIGRSTRRYGITLRKYHKAQLRAMLLMTLRGTPFTKGATATAHPCTGPMPGLAPRSLSNEKLLVILNFGFAKKEVQLSDYGVDFEILYSTHSKDNVTIDEKFTLKSHEGIVLYSPATNANN